MRTGLFANVAALLSVSLFLSLFLVTAASAITWEAPETVDQPVTEVSSTSGASAIWAGDSWYVVYCREGQVFWRVYGPGGWQAAEAVSTVPGTASSPHLDTLGSLLAVVWEDTRTGHPEVWIRTWNAAWSAESCLTEDTVPSRVPALSWGLLTWQEGDAGSDIVSRLYTGIWGPPVTVSLGAGDAREPTVIRVFQGFEAPTHVVAWSDSRNGASEIYARLFNRIDQSWGTERRLTDLPGECRHPVVGSEVCCGSEVFGHYFVAFEHTAPGGVPESWSACVHFPGDPVVTQISPDDGIPSPNPSLASYRYWDLDGQRPKSVIAYADVGATSPVNVAHGEVCPADNDAVDTVAESSLAPVAVAAFMGEPDAHVIVLWIDEADGVPTLFARRGTTPGGITGVASDSQPGAMFLAVTPNPCRGPATVHLGGAPGAVDLRIFDVHGRLIRSLSAGASGGDAAVVVWDGRDGRGQPVAAGLYAMTASASGSFARKAVLVLR